MSELSVGYLLQESDWIRHLALSLLLDENAPLGAKESWPEIDQPLDAQDWEWQLAELVIAIEEPYRSAILFRFSEGKSPREIAAQLQVPVGVIRERIKSGLIQIRFLLDKKFGDRWTWSSYLLPLASVPVPEAPVVPRRRLLQMSWEAPLAAAVLLALSMYVFFPAKDTTRYSIPGYPTAGMPIPVSFSPPAKNPPQKVRLGKVEEAGFERAPGAQPLLRNQFFALMPWVKRQLTALPDWLAGK